MREDFAEEVDEVTADEALEVIVGDGRGGGGIEHLLDCAADVLGGVQQGAVDVKQVNRKAGNDHAGWGRAPSESPGRRRPPSGRITCCVWSSESFDPETGA